MDHNFKRGDIVTVINSTIGGKAIIEGKASILKPTGLSEDHYEVKFVNSLDICDRFINPAAQGNPQAFVDNLNAST